MSDEQRLRPLVLYLEAADLYGTLAFLPGTSALSPRADGRLVRLVARAQRRLGRRYAATRPLAGDGWTFEDWCAARRLVRDAQRMRELTAIEGGG